MIINNLKDVLLLILGWLLGLLAPIITATIRDKREVKSLKTALITELHELQYKLVLMAYLIESKYGELNHDFFKWAQSVLVGYSGINSIESLLKTIGPLLNLTEKEMVDFSQYNKSQKRPNSGLTLKKYTLFFLESNIASLTKFNKILQGQLLEIKNRIGFMNDIVEESRYYFELSFQSGISHGNYEIAKTNLIDSYKSYASQVRDVSKIIGKVLSS